MEPGLGETLAVVRCVECGEEAVESEGWRLRFSDLGEVAPFCPKCDEREFRDSTEQG